VGNHKKDPPVEDWLLKIKEGCQQRSVPKEYWHKVGQHYMGDAAKLRYALPMSITPLLMNTFPG
jgi:hypothetical protein